MTDDELHAAILADSEAKALADGGRDNAAADRIAALQAPVPAVGRMHNYRSIGNALLAANLGRGADFASALAAAEATLTKIRTVLTASPEGLLASIDTGLRTTVGVEVGTPAFMAGLAFIRQAASLSDAEYGDVLALCLQPVTIDHGQVSRVWFQYRPHAIVQTPWVE